jgi:hypothetical protein
MGMTRIAQPFALVFAFMSVPAEQKLRVSRSAGIAFATVQVTGIVTCRQQDRLCEEQGQRKWRLEVI